MQNFNSWIWDIMDCPCYDRKSFYKKALILRRTATNEYILRSYNMDVAAFINGKFLRLWNGYSVTTMRHVNAFLKYLQIPGGGKKWWDALPVEKSPNSGANY